MMMPIEDAVALLCLVTLIALVLLERTLGRWLERLHTTSGGASETELKELTVSPTGSPPGPRAVITVTPVGNMPSVSRKARTSGSFL